MTSHYENMPIQIYWDFTTKKWNFQTKNSDIFHISAQTIDYDIFHISAQNIDYDIFHISAQNIDYGYSLEPPQQGGSNEYPQSMFLSRNNKNNVYPCRPQFYCIKVGFNPAEPGYTLLLQTVQIQISWLLKKPTDLDLHCLPLSMWIYINNLDQVIWFAEN